MTEREALIALNCIQGIGAVTVRRVMERLGSAAAAFNASEDDLMEVPGIGAERAQLIRSANETDMAARELQQAATCGVRLITWDEPEYPPSLQTISDPPIVLYVAGSLDSAKVPSVAIVGTRRATIYGRGVARRFGYGFAAAGYTVVSGLAEGIDTEAHAGALQAKGKTIAVLGGALDRLYPKSNTKLAREIVLGGGAVISEYPFGRQPDAQTFPMRNRIVSGLCAGVLAVEAPFKSGTLITVSQALEQGRTVMVVPGPIDSPSSQGTNKLLRDGARLVTSVDDAIEELQDLFAGTRQALAVSRGTASVPVPATTAPARKPLAVRENVRPTPILSEEERTVLKDVGAEPISIDSLVRLSGLNAGRINALLVGLQIKRLLRMLPGGLIKRFEEK